MRAISITVISTARRLGGPKKGPVLVPRAVTRTQMVSPFLHRVLDGEGDVGGGGVHLPHGGFDVPDRLGSGPGQAELVLDHVRRAQLVDDVIVPGGEAFEHSLHHGQGHGAGGLLGLR
jgi:hypothetical protein